MKTIRNCKINRICYKLYSKYRKNVISLVTAAVLLVTSMPLADVSNVVSKMVSTLTNTITAMAADAETAAASEYVQSNTQNGQYTVSNAKDLQMLFKADAAVYADKTIMFAKIGGNFSAEDLEGITSGLGSETAPFKGKLTASMGSAITLPIGFALFNYLADSAVIDQTLTIQRSESSDTALFAENVIHTEGNDTPQNWSVTEVSYENEGSAKYSFTSVIGEMKDGSIANLTIQCEDDAVVSKTSGNTGLACGTMGKNAQLTVSPETANFTVKATKTAGSNVGSLVGEMSRGAKLTVAKSCSFTGTITGENAGGIVGKATDSALVTGEGVNVSVTGTVKGSVSAGGMFGTYIFTSDDKDTFLSDLQLTNWSGINVTLDSCATSTGTTIVGGLFGLLINNSNGNAVAINGSDDITVGSSFLGSILSSCYGGIVGRYQTSKLTNSLIFKNVNTQLGSFKNVNDVGGVIGNIYQNQNAYVKIDSAHVSMPENGTSNNNNGGLIGYVYHGTIDVYGSVTISDKGASATNFGGLIGRFVDGGSILRISGKTDLTDAYPASASANRCQIVGMRGDALVYALGNGTSLGDNGSGWQLIRNSSVKIDDMNWGGVLRIDGTNLTESENSVQGRDTDVLYFDKDAHIVTIKGFESNNVKINNKADFARIALIMQQSENTYVKYSKNSVKKSDMLAATIGLNIDIDISDTGLTGFMRDSDKDTFTGTFNGNNKKFTMTVGTNDANVVFHTFNGLFAKTSGAKISDVTLISTFNIVGDNAKGGNECHIGSVSAYNSGALTVDNVTANVTASPSGEFTNFVGGMVGYVADATNDVSFTDSKVNADLTYNADTTSRDCTVLGGVIGLVDGVDSEPNAGTGIKFNNVTVSGTITDKHNGSNARVGGLIAEVRGKAEEVSYNTKHNNIFITNVNIDNLTINANGKVNNSGGFFGHNWYRVEVTLDSLTVNGCHLNVTKGTELGGLVLSTTGYWKISKVKFAGTEVNAPMVNRYGMLAATLFGRSSDPYGFNYQTGAAGSGYKCLSDATYFEFITPNGYNITDTTIKIKSSYTMFDEIAARSLKESSEFVSSAQAIISIPAVNENGDYLVDMDGVHCNTYQNQTKNGTANWRPDPNSRYYYNIHKYKDAPINLKTGGERLMQWSTKLFAANNIKNYIYNGSISFPTDKKIDLKGYSYYPVDTAGCTIGTSEIAFYNKEFNESENAANGNTDDYARTTEGKNTQHSQHYMMQSGIFRNCNSSINSQVKVDGKLTLKGNIGMVDGGSGALICGSVTNGNSIKRYVQVTDKGSIVLDGLYVNNSNIAKTDYAPLLINKIENYAEITIKNVSAAKHKNTDPAYYMGEQDYAATSLIGDVGSATSHDLLLNFSGIKLAASSNDSIFSKATLLNSFQYSGSTSTGTYNYSYDEDWDKNSSGEYKRNVTYGKEVTSSLKNPNQQNKYYGDWDADDRYTSPEEGKTSEAYDFISTGYLPYVAKSKVTDSSLSDSQYHEIDVNVRRPNLNKGCGTYSDPYIIDDGDQLVTVANAIDGTINVNWEVNYNPAVSTNKPTVDGKTAFCSSRNTTHQKYKYNGTEFVSEDSSSTVVVNDFKKYLCEAYYLIDGDITLGKTFAGLGGTENDKVFRGVIIGKKDGTSYPKITNKSQSSLIRSSGGSVVKDVNIVNNVTRELTKTDTAQITYATNSSEIYGGVIAVVSGGDNIIDNVSVQQPALSFNGSSEYLIPAGGYVGAVIYGGVIFRNMGTAAASSKLTIDETAENDTQHLYVNPYIGRVVNGFAIEEGTKFGKSTTLDNGKKNYPITQLNDNYSDDEKLVIGNPKFAGFDVIKVPNAQALFMLSIISQSGMGYTDKYNDTCGYGWYTSTHTAEYSGVGSAGLTYDNEDYQNAISDYQRLDLKNSKNNDYDNKISVMLKKYVPAAVNSDTTTKYYEAKWSHEEGRNYTIELTGDGDYDLTDTGFRGINQMFSASLGKTNCGYSLSFVKINGNGHKIILDMAIKAYVAQARDNNDDNSSIDNYKFRNGIGGQSYAAGIGLINATNKPLTVDNIALSGKIDIRTYDSANNVYTNEVVSTGAIAGTAGQKVDLTNINIDGLDIHGAYTTGSLLGKTYGKVTISNVTSTDKGISVYGGFECGGLVGSSQGNSGFAVSDCEIKLNKVEIDNALTDDIKNWFGMGGVAGTSSSSTALKNVKVLSTGSDSFIGTTDENDYPAVAKNMRVGGMIGLATSNATCTFDSDVVDVNLYGRVVGGMVGESSKEVTITSCSFGGESKDSKAKVYGYLYAGGMFGYHTEKLTIEKSTVKNAVIAIPAACNGKVGIGGYVGCKNSDLVLKDCAVLNCEISNSDASKTAGVGGIVGRNAVGTTAAYDILEDNIKYTRKNANTSVGNLIGWNVSDLTSKFIGVSVNNTDFSETVADSNNTDNSVNVTAIHTNYKGVANNTAVGVAGVNSKNHVEINSPYVNVDPAKTYADITLTGDFVAGNMADIVNAAASDSTASKKYQNTGVTSSADEIQAKYLSKLTNFDSVADQSNDDVKGMPILLIDDNSSVNITKMLSDYVSVLTNHDTDFNKDQSDLLSVSVETYGYDSGSGSWTSLDNAKSLTYDESRHLFKTKNGVYDNDGTARFTLITLDYADPTNAEQTAVRIHIPVFVKKVLDYSFTSNVLTGTDYCHSDYEGQQFAFESFGSPITTYFSFTYYRKAQEWQDAINGGDSLLWSFAKKIYLFGDKGGSSGVLPDGTKFTLVDTNREDKAYQATAGEVGFDKTTGMLDMSKFNGFTAATLNDILLKYASVTVAEDTAGTLVETESKADATVQAYLDGTLKYFRAATEDELANTDVKKYTATVTAKESTENDKSGRMKITESYYLTLTTPADTDTQLIKNYVDCASDSSKKLEGDLPTNQISSDTDIATYIIANFLTQKVTITPTSEEEITATNSLIRSQLNAKITLNKELKDTFIDYTKNGFDMYQAFKFSLKKYDASANGTAEQIVGGTTVNVDYSLRSESGDTIEGTAISSREMLDESKDYYMLEYPESIWTQFLKEGVYTIQVQADMKITYDTSTMITQFPERKVEGDSTTGISVNATSMVAYNKNSTEKSSIATTAKEPDRHFYRRAMTAADLSYNVPESKVIEAKDSPYSQLGVNPRDMSSEKMQITAKGHYDLSKLNESIRKQGKQIRFTLTLYKKTEEDKYEKVDDIKKYLDGISLTGKNDVIAANAIAHDASECAFVFSNYNGEETYDITTKYNVITGSAFEENGQTYANYKVLLTVDLLDGNGKTMSATSASDYIVYTNAKINTSFIEK
ncbi:hypothetical protein [uncultured Ruminococcus sp.]|uniref:hypothetical protein n=1 Tax=uncultured Ruminococcus sp. TaxID=165186 RepID=UPI0026651315|nr:hypothetical protein [uncultured Ruminococcus sp.]